MKCTLPSGYTETKYAVLKSHAQIGCNKYLETVKDRYYHGKALHVGTGTFSLLTEFSDIFSKVDGITVIQEEVETAKYLIGKYRKSQVYKMNKYDPERFSTIPHGYSVINDVGLKQFACCQDHWETYFSSLLDRLVPGGILITHTQGFSRGVEYAIEDLTTTELVQMLIKIPDRKYELSEISEMTNKFECYPVIIKKL